MKNNVSILIRTFNEASYADLLIQKLLSQSEYENNLEIVVVDSGSTDGTIDVLKKYNVKIIRIAKEEFNYSSALNLGIEYTNGDLIVVISAHAIPCNCSWLKQMASNFSDENVAGAYCRQIPWPHAEPTEKIRIEKSFKKESKIYSVDLPYKNNNFSNVASCIRRDIWERHHFVIMPAAEDRQWANWAIENGYKIVYDANAIVYHSHNESSRKAAKRVIQLEKSFDIENKRNRNLFLTLKQSFGWFIRDVRYAFRLNYEGNNRLKYIIECAARSFWFIYDFSRAD